MEGKVIFIGGGPGDPELLTVKGQKVIETAEIIIYAGSLVNKKILNCSSEGAKIYNSASMNLEDIIELMEKEVKNGKIVARVHTGDPSIYGAIGEQIRELENRKINYEIIPGVSSLFATAAALKTELTLPEISQTVIITRPEGRTPKPSKEQLSALAQHQATMCIFLGVHMIKDVVRDLLECYPLQTPVGVVKKASWDEELVVRGTLENISDKVKEAGITKTALIIVGKVLDPGDFKVSKLYDAEFTHEYREGSKDI
ncbi:precorrin-4 C(11)-methyltransferase [Methanobacterium alcaliphilum]|uniref:precorrin-4 C(11)-methyltransferase n=1 Tax=Methanobacterium alcaliphilum TaxID=392018 RepID=UPI00200B4BEB|nr:precorrin-4 C(11)-methyltransferase [Methanobacterium alcaliphilum]MCK9152473.1 precorrin-4 C(11)-methyltransferase [Methanobacterium alcaliphilum]